MEEIFCGNSAQSNGTETIQSPTFLSGIINPYSCTNHIFLIISNLLLFLITITLLSTTLHFRHKRSSTTDSSSPSYIQTRAWASASAAGAFSSAIGFGYLGLGFWNLGNDLIHDKIKLLPWQQLWITESVQGVTCLFLGLTLSLNKRCFVALSRGIIYLYSCSLLSCFIAALQCAFALRSIVLDKSASTKVTLDVLLFPGTILLLVSALRIYRAAAVVGGGKELDVSSDGTFYTPLRDEDEDDDDINAVTPFSKAGFFSRLSFWWLNPLLRKGSQTVLDDNDIPRLRKQDRAKTCYLDFMDRISKHKGKKGGSSSSQPSILSTIFSWQKRQIFISGVFALIKVLTLATGPLFLKAFINVAEGDKEGFTYKGYALAALLFLTKCLESFSERQWSFRTRMSGLQVRSMLCAAIYQKQLKLSNTAKTTHSPGEIVNYVTVDAYRIGEFPIWFHQLWTVGLQMSLALVIIYYSVGLATIATLAVVVLSVLVNSPLGKLQQKNQTKLMAGQDKRLRAIAEALVTMKVLKLYAWEMHFKSVIEKLREIEFKSLSAVSLQKGYYIILFWSFPIVMSVSTFGACYILGVGLNASNVFMFLATLRIIQEPVRLLPDVAGAYIEASVSLDRILRFLEAPELQNQQKQEQAGNKEMNSEAIVVIRSTGISWESFSLKPTLRNINLIIRSGEKVAICGEVGTGKSTLLATILGEVPNVNGSVQVHGKIAYVSQTAWIQTGTIRENILFGSAFYPLRYQDTIARCSLVKDVEMLPFGDLTVIGERGVNLSGGQKQRIQLARALYQDADLYLLDDPFSAVDAHTATSLFYEYVMGALSRKTVLLVTHQVDFLPAFDSLLLMCEGQILRSGTFSQLMETSPEFQSLVNAHKDGIHLEIETKNVSSKTTTSHVDIHRICTDDQTEEVSQDQLIQQEERETGDSGLKPYVEYLSQGKGFLYLSIAVSAHILFLAGQSLQSYWLAANLGNSNTSGLKLIAVYSIIGGSLALLLFIRSFATVTLSLEASKSTFCTLLSSLFQAPMSFFDSTPVGRILSRVSSDISIIDLDVAFMISQTMAATLATFFSFGILAILTWEVLFVIIPMVYLTTILQKYYFASAKELMRTNGTTKSAIASNLAESISGATTIRAFNKEDQFFTRNVEIIDKNASPFFHGFSANEWLIQYLEILCAVVLSSSALALTVLPSGATSSGFIGMALSYGLSLNLYLVGSVQNQCTLSNMIISAERISQYMHIQSESPEIIQDNRPPSYWPHAGRLEISDLKVRYRQNSPLVLQGITCTFEGGSKIGIVGRTGSGKTTLLSTLFRLVEPSEGKIIIDGIDITTIGLHDLRSSLGIIPQDPTLFSGSVRYNLDPLSHHSEQEIWDVLEKCQLKDAVRKKEGGLDSFVLQDGLNWSMGQRQLFCLGRALLKRRKILVLDEATASIDNTTDAILQRTIRTEFVHCTVITVAHRIPTVMDCTKVLAISDGKVVEFDEPVKLISKENSLFGQLVQEYWSHSRNASCLSG